LRISWYTSCVAPRGEVAEDAPAPHRVDPREVLVQPEGVELRRVHRPRLALRHDLRQRLARDPRDLPPRREHPLDHLGHLEARVAEAQENRLRVLVEQRDRLARLQREPRVRRGQHVEVEEHHRRLDDAAAHRVGELLEHP
jgi:hypothetical protein